jgi:glycosyltransferase involved in cell wall biosynthesis
VENPAHELLVVDDGSSDGSGALAAERGARVLRLTGRGPAAARNAGAEAARTDLLFFLDADVRARPSTLAVAIKALDRAPAADAVFGSYDDEPPAPGWASQFKNLHHHWTHQRGSESASTFWAGCGIIRRAAFEAAGGYDEGRFPRPSVEDIELGHRLCAGGFTIRLEKRLLVTHLKSWRLRDVVRSDVLDRAAPWMELVLEGRGATATLNLRPGQVAAALLGLPFPPLLPILQPSFYRFLARRRGTAFALTSWPLHWLYFASGAAGAALGVARFAARRLR